MRMPSGRTKSRVFILVAVLAVVILSYTRGPLAFDAVVTAKDKIDTRENAVIVSLARNEELYDLLQSIQSLEDRFNHQFHYDWVFLNDKKFSEDFINETSQLVSGKTYYGKIDESQWSIPEYVDKKKVEQRLSELDNLVKYGGSESYRHMCRYNSGFFYKHPLLQKYKYYWRVEPGVRFYCDIPYDVFKFMREKGKKYGFTVALFENVKTIPSLWIAVREYMQTHTMPETNFMSFISPNGGKDYNTCHFWSNFEIADMDIWRSEFYEDFFNFLDKKGGFYYERWGDAPVHSIGAALQLSADQFHFFEDIGYSHSPITACTNNDDLRRARQCSCNPILDFNPNYYVSCMEHFLDTSNTPYPPGWGQHVQPTLGGPLDVEAIIIQEENLKTLEKYYMKKLLGEIDGVIENSEYLDSIREEERKKEDEEKQQQEQRQQEQQQQEQQQQEQQQQGQQ